MNRYLVGILAFVGLAILLLVLLLTGGHKAPPTNTTIPLPKYYNSGAEVRLVIDGPIVAPVNHSSIQISVSQYAATEQVYQGYDGNMIGSVSTPNSPSSFENFLYAIYYAGFQEGQSSSFLSDIGLCQQSDRYDMYLYNNGRTLEHLWLTNCNGLPKTFSGNFPLVQQLFKSQIPNPPAVANTANI